MTSITDTNDAALTSVSLVLTESTSSGVLVIRVPCQAGQYLASTVDSLAQVLARRTGSGAAFVDIAVAPILLTPYAGSTVEFDVKVSAQAVTGLQRVALPVRVTYTP